MGNEDVWHGSTDILIGESNDVSVTVFPDDDDEEEEEFHLEIKTDTSANMHVHRNQLIAETIVFGFLQRKMEISHQNFLVPTIEITKNKVKIFFYDAEHDFLLESSKMDLFLGKKVGLNPSTVIALWLAINYPVTCSGLTEAVVSTGFKADFLKNFQEYIKEKYKKKLRFGKCQKKRVQDTETDDVQSTDFNAEYSKPFGGKSECLLTKEDKLYITDEARRAKKRFKQS